MQKRRRRTSFGDWLSLIGFLLLVGGALIIFVQVNRPPGTSTSDSPINPAVANQMTPTAVADAQAEPTTPQPTITSYDAISDAQLLIPAAGINAPVIRVYLDGQSWDVSNLGMNIGHLQGTRWLGEGPGNIVLSGHVELRDGRQGIFASLRELTEGNRIILQQNGIEQQYSVREIRNVDPADLTPLYPTEGDLLTLITCDDYDFFRDSYQERTIVVAERIG